MTVCSVCGEEVRFGVRAGDSKWPSGRWLHREDQDHEPRLGSIITPEKWDEITANKEAQVADRASRSKKQDESEKIVWEEIPEPEQRATPVEVDSFPPRSGIRQIINLILKTDGWELRRLTAARGPYVGSLGKVLSISDSVLVSARGPEVDGGHAFVAAWWRDGKFEAAQVGIFRGGRFHARLANSADLKNWIKTCDLPDTLQQPGEQP